jgi:hypothetical protein
MSNLTANRVNGLMEAYAAVYDTNIREQLEEEREEEREVQEVGFQIIENAANVLFSQGYDVNDLCDYFEKASTEVISEDYLNFAEGKTYISESFIVSDKYVQEQFNILEDLLGASEMLSEAGFMASQRSKLAAQRAANPNPVPKSTPIPSPAKPKVTSSSNPKITSSPNSRVTSNYSVPASQMGPKLPPKPGILQKAGNFAKGLMSKAKDVAKKIPGAGTAAKIAKSPVGKFAGKVGSRVLPGVGAVAYGADAAKRFKKGDWGGGLLSTAGAVTSAIPGAGLVAGLAPAAIQMGTDALGLTGDKSKKGPKTVGRKIVGPKIVGPKIVGPKPSSPSGGGGGSSRPPASSTPGSSKLPASKPAPTADNKLTKMQQWAKANPKLAAKVKVGQSGYDEISATRTKPGPNEKQDQTPTQGPSDAKIDPKAVSTALKAQQERDKKKAQPQTVSSSYEYDAYDLVLEYLLSQGHADTLEEANYVMLEMGAEMIGDIVEVMEGSGMVTGTAKVINTILKPVNQTPEQEKSAVRNLTKGLDVVAKPIKNFLSVSPEQNKQMMNKRRP